MSAALPLSPTKFISEFDSVAHQHGFKTEPYGQIDGHLLSAYVKRTPGPRPRIYLSAGIHGDEPAPPLALLQLMKESCFDRRCTWFICPLINPTGFIHGTRENTGKIDLNRDYKNPVTEEVRAHSAWLQRQPNFDLAICVHEDWESQGFYLYELNPQNRPTLAGTMIEAARTVCPIDSATLIDGREVAETGIIRPVSDPLLRETWPEAIYLRNFHSTLVYTIETPSALPLELRTATHCAVLRAAIETFCLQSESDRVEG